MRADQPRDVYDLAFKPRIPALRFFFTGFVLLAEPDVGLLDGACALFTGVERLVAFLATAAPLPRSFFRYGLREAAFFPRKGDFLAACFRSGFGLGRFFAFFDTGGASPLLAATAGGSEITCSTRSMLAEIVARLS